MGNEKGSCSSIYYYGLENIKKGKNLNKYWVIWWPCWQYNKIVTLTSGWGRGGGQILTSPEVYIVGVQMKESHFNHTSIVSMSQKLLGHILLGITKLANQNGTHIQTHRRRRKRLSHNPLMIWLFKPGGNKTDNQFYVTSTYDFVSNFATVYV